MKNLLFVSLLILVSSATAGTSSAKVDLTCTLNSITPSEIDNPKAGDYWNHGSILKGVSLDINTYGIHLKGAMVERTWEQYSGDITDWYYTFKFNGPYHDGGAYNKISLNTLTGGGFFYIDYSKDTPDPDYGIRCKEFQEEIEEKQE